MAVLKTIIFRQPLFFEIRKEANMLQSLKYISFIIGLVCFANLQKIIGQISPVTNFDEKNLTQFPFDSLKKSASLQFGTNVVLADKIYDIIIAKATNLQDNKQLYDIYRIKGDNYENQSQFQKALSCYQSAAQVIEKIDNNLYNGVQIDIAVVNIKLQNYTESRNVYLHLLENTIKTKDFDNEFRALCGLGVLYCDIYDYTSAIQYYNEALKVAEKINNKEYICLTLSNLSETYLNKKQTNEALVVIEKAYQIILTTDDYESKNSVYQQYIQILANLGRFEEAFAKIEEGFMQCQGEYAQRYRNVLSIVKGQTFLKNNNTAAAETEFLTCLARPQNVTNLTKINYELGKIYQNQGNSAKAKTFLIQCRELAEKNNFSRYSEWSHRALYEIYFKEKDATNALFHLQEANMLRDSMFDFEKYSKISELQFRFGLEQREREVREIELKSSKKIMLAGAFAAFAVIAALMLFIRHRNKTNQRLIEKNQQIKAQNLQLEAFNKEVEEQKRLLEDSNAMLKQFNYAVAHDLKEPLRGIGNFVKIIQRRYIKDLPEDAHGYFDFVTSGVTRMGGMLDGLLKYSMVSMNQVTEIEDVALNDVMNDVTASLQLKIAESNAEIIIPENMPMLHINKIHATQLIQNLVSNALKFVEENPRIEIETKENHENLLISIRDNGIGISKESGAKLFQLFNRVHSDTSRFEGTGIGLALCKNIVEKYKGKIWFESELNQGTQFFIELPKAA